MLAAGIEVTTLAPLGAPPLTGETRVQWPLRLVRLLACVAIGSAGVLLLAPDSHAAPPACYNSVCTINPETLELFCAYQENSYCGFTGTADRPVCISISRCVPH